MKEGWKKVKLGDVCKTKTTINWSKHTTADYKYIDLTSVDRDDFVINETISINANNAPSRAKQIVNTGDILFGTTRPMLKRCCIVPQKYDTQICSTGFCVIKPLIDIISSKWIFYNLLSDPFYEFMAPLQKGIAYPAISNSDVLSYQIPLPPLSTQQQIVDELDKINDSIHLLKTQLDDYDKLEQSIFYDMFGDPITNEKGWEIKKLGDVCSKIGSGATPKGGKQSYGTDGISLIRSLNVHNGKFKYEELAHINEEQAKQLDNVIIEKDDVLLNITGASVARCCIVPNNVLPARVNQHVCIIRPQNLLLTTYLCSLLINSSYQEVLLHKARLKAATREALPKNVVEKLVIPLPPLSLQQSFAERIEKIELLKAKTKAQIADAEQLLNRQMDEYFD